MIFRSNLSAPDLSHHFKYLHARSMGHSFGHDVPSDWGDKRDDDPIFGEYKRCGFWTHDEAAILYNIAGKIHGDWLDVGAHTGWTAAHILAGGSRHVEMVDPLYADQRFASRAMRNMISVSCQFRLRAVTSANYFDSCSLNYEGIVIDADHHEGEPLKDAKAAVQCLGPRGVILMHDFVGLPVREAVLHLLIYEKMRVRLYLTPHVVACCWRPSHEGSPFVPPSHLPDPLLVAENLPKRWAEFDWSAYF